MGQRYPVVIQGQRSGREHTKMVVASSEKEARRIVTERGSSVVSIGESVPLTINNHEVDCFKVES